MFKASEIVAQARDDKKRFGISEEVYKAYCLHYSCAKTRQIPFEISLPDWWAWWLTENRWANRGAKASNFVMA